MKILHLIDSRAIYGAEQVVLTLLKGMNEDGHEAILGSIRLHGEDRKPIEIEAARQGIPVWALFVGRGFDYRATAALRRRCDEEGVDVVHTHGYKANIVGALFLARRGSFKTLATLHGWTSTSPSRRIWWYEKFERQVLHRFDAVVAVHGNMAFAHGLDRRVQQRMHVILNGITAERATIHPSEYTPGQLSLVHFCERKPTIGIVGRISAEKAVEDGIRAFHALRSKGIDLQLAIVGTGSRSADCRALVETLGHSDNVLFAGFVEQTGRLLDKFKMLVLPSSQEGMPIIILEAMRAQVPIVATKVGGIPDLLDGGRCGRLVLPHNIAELELAMGEVIQYPDRTQTLVNNAFDRFGALYSDQITLAKYAELYAQLLSPESTLERAVR